MDCGAPKRREPGDNVLGSAGWKVRLFAAVGCANTVLRRSHMNVPVCPGAKCGNKVPVPGYSKVILIWSWTLSKEVSGNHKRIVCCVGNGR